MIVLAFTNRVHYRVDGDRPRVEDSPLAETLRGVLSAVSSRHIYSQISLFKSMAFALLPDSYIPGSCSISRYP
ncbi:MAG: hypothetical protein ACE5EE_00640 [Fidelibacterota bacterium]